MVLVLGVGAVIQVRLIVMIVIRFFRSCPEGKELGKTLNDEYLSLTCLSGPGPDRRREELKKLLDQFNAADVGRLMSPFILIALSVMVLALYGLLLFGSTPGSSSLAPQVSIPRLQRELEQVDSGQLESAEVWIQPKVYAGSIPDMWGSGYKNLTVRCRVLNTAPGSKWIDILVPVAMEFSPSTERPFRESQSIPWNLEHAQRYQVRDTSNFHLAVEITPIP